MKKLLLLVCVIPLLLSTGCIFDPNEVHQTPEGYYQWGFDAYTFWYNPYQNTTFEVSYMGRTYELAPYEVMIANPESQSVLFKIWRFESDWAREDPLRISLGRGVKSKYAYWPPGTQLRIVMYRGGCEFEPIFWTLE